jgi:tetratricopeptide (TPR) repeat protein
MKRPMRPRQILALAGCLLALGLLFSAAQVTGQEQEKFTNLKILPKDISNEKLDDIMRAFSSSLGVRCGYCHAAKDGDARGQLDFASDSKPEKTTARMMMTMSAGINQDQLPKITTKRGDKVEVRCRTCHHGQARPYLIDDLLTASYNAGGIDSLTARYEALRTAYYGTDAFNFGEWMLPQLGQDLAGKDKPQVTVKLAEYNLKYFPQSGNAYLALGQAHMNAGEKDAAEAALKKAAELDPKLQDRVQRMLNRLQQGPPPQK